MIPRICNEKLALANCQGRWTIELVQPGTMAAASKHELAFACSAPPTDHPMVEGVRHQDVPFGVQGEPSGIIQLVEAIATSMAACH
mmetsp:Transcript_47562/g.106814  ORF Transcript_47562/g.106814 Transcript_47562/m.106814 type:complete len:86 (+) Transcript_47562:39-296(+)